MTISKWPLHEPKGLKISYLNLKHLYAAPIKKHFPGNNPLNQPKSNTKSISIYLQMISQTSIIKINIPCAQGT